MGDATDFTLFNKSWMFVMFGIEFEFTFEFEFGFTFEEEEGSTTKEIDFQDLPPAPEEEVKSIVKLSHGPITDGIDIDTTGETGEAGAATEMF